MSLTAEIFTLFGALVRGTAWSHGTVCFLCPRPPAAASEAQWKRPLWAGLCSHRLAAWGARAPWPCPQPADSTALGLRTGQLRG